MKKYLNIFWIILGLGIFSSVQATAPSQDENCEALGIKSSEATLQTAQKSCPSGQVPFVREIRIQGDQYYCCRVTQSPSTPSTPTTPSQPTGSLFTISISSISPDSGPAETSILIKGNNFNTTCPLNDVIFTIDGNPYVYAAPECPVTGQQIKIPIPDFVKIGQQVNVQVRTFVGATQMTSKPFPFQVEKSVSGAIPPPGGVVSAPSGSGASLGRDCEGKPLTIKNPSLYVAGDKVAAYDGLVPCGKCVVITAGSLETIKKQVKDGGDKITGNSPKYVSCQFCHFFVMFDGIVDFITWKIIFPLGVLLIVIGGLMFVFSAGDPARTNKARALLTSVGIGLTIILVAWIAVSVFFTFIGLSDFGMGLTGPSQWFKPVCPINIGGQTFPSPPQSPSQSPSTAPAVTPPTTPTQTTLPPLPPEEEPIPPFPPLPPEVNL